MESSPVILRARNTLKSNSYARKPFRSPCARLHGIPPNSSQERNPPRRRYRQSRLQRSQRRPPGDYHSFPQLTALFGWGPSEPRRRAYKTEKRKKKKNSE